MDGAGRSVGDIRPYSLVVHEQNGRRRWPFEMDESFAAVEEEEEKEMEILRPAK